MSSINPTGNGTHEVASRCAQIGRGLAVLAVGASTAVVTAVALTALSTLASTYIACYSVIAGLAAARLACYCCCLSSRGTMREERISPQHNPSSTLSREKGSLVPSEIAASSNHTSHLELLSTKINTFSPVQQPQTSDNDTSLIPEFVTPIKTSSIKPSDQIPQLPEIGDASTFSNMDVHVFLTEVPEEGSRFVSTPRALTPKQPTPSQNITIEELPGLTPVQPNIASNSTQNYTISVSQNSTSTEMDQAVEKVLSPHLQNAQSGFKKTTRSSSLPRINYPSPDKVEMTEINVRESVTTRAADISTNPFSNPKSNANSTETRTAISPTNKLVLNNQDSTTNLATLPPYIVNSQPPLPIQPLTTIVSPKGLPEPFITVSPKSESSSRTPVTDDIKMQSSSKKSYKTTQKNKKSPDKRNKKVK